MGKKLVVSFVFLFSLFSNKQAHANTDVLARCKMPSAREKAVAMNDFKWGYNLQELLAKATEIYVSGKRLKDRAYFDESKKEYVVPVSTSSGKKVAAIHSRFIESIKKHIKISLLNHYADVIVFPDMGHSHFFIPPQVNEKLNKINYTEDKNIFYEELFKEPEVKSLYHTAEQITLRDGERGQGKILDNDYLQWRYYTRNVVGKNDASEDVKPYFAHKEKFNTLHELDGYEYFGAGINLNASQYGCFEIVHDNQKLFFDISLEDIGYSSDIVDQTLNL